ncbi:uncharacterized protein BDW43DRAFT_292406 [Aspergillus alliaceus]|uniref:uncharacterized protein n=1 Tax=Petromyces alliaceus TaxID=209559 RepID=UPI0012A5FCC1|nr:uncharacterized protein BDW43DRAFT_292406 [Aspergillus alliaceus]KAB8228041.1 hypothetical protein BDW43DRAFT_292406 [Aspergillus alliaceus]
MHLAWLTFGASIFALTAAQPLQARQEELKKVKLNDAPAALQEYTRKFNSFVGQLDNTCQAEVVTQRVILALIGSEESISDYAGLIRAVVHGLPGDCQGKLKHAMTQPTALNSKLRWFGSYDFCFRDGTEIDCGTKRYCEDQRYREFFEFYESPEQCLAARKSPQGASPNAAGSEPPLSSSTPTKTAHIPLKPFYPAPTGIQFTTFNRGSEEVLGTKVYCAENQYPYTEEEGEVFKDEKECLAAREPEPSSSAEPSPSQATDSNRIIYPDEWERISSGSTSS